MLAAESGRRACLAESSLPGMGTVAPMSSKRVRRCVASTPLCIAGALAFIAAGCESVVYGVTSSSWLDDGSLLVAGPTFGVAKVTCEGTIEQRWLRRADKITGVCALPGNDRCLVEAWRDHVSPHGSFGNEVPEMYSLDLRDGSMTRITNDEWEERL